MNDDLLSSLISDFWAAPEQALFNQKAIAPVLGFSEAWLERAFVFLNTHRGSASQGERVHLHPSPAQNMWRLPGHGQSPAGVKSAHLTHSDLHIGAVRKSAACVYEQFVVWCATVARKGGDHELDG